MLNNMKKFIAVLIGWHGNSNINNFKAYSGSNCAFYYASSYKHYISTALRTFRASGDGYGFVLGTSNIPTNEDDYCLKGDFLSGSNISILVPSTDVAPIATDDFVGFVASYTITAKSDVQIGEMGVLVDTNSSVTADNTVMIDRVTFDEPIALKTGESKTITYRMKIG